MLSYQYKKYTAAGLNVTIFLQLIKILPFPIVSILFISLFKSCHITREKGENGALLLQER